MITKNNIVHLGKENGLLTKIPKPPTYLSNSGKKHYKKMALKLIKLKRLKEVFLNALEIYAEAMATWEWAARERKEKNKEEPGSGYIQTYRTGATNLSTELILMRDSEKTLFKCFKQFGIDPRSEKELNSTVDPNQGDLFAEFGKLKKS